MTAARPTASRRGPSKWYGSDPAGSGNVAWPGEKDPRARYVDVYAYARYADRHACQRRPGVSNGKYELTSPASTRTCAASASSRGVGKFHLIDLPTALLDEHKQRKSGEFSISVSRVGNEYHTGADAWPRFRAFGEII